MRRKRIDVKRQRFFKIRGVSNAKRLVREIGRDHHGGDKLLARHFCTVYGSQRFSGFSVT